MRATDTDYLHANITGVRNRMLLGLIAFSKQAIADACGQRTKPPCGNTTCVKFRTGILVTELTPAGLYPVPSDAEAMYRNVLSYWKAIKLTGREHTAYSP